MIDMKKPRTVLTFFAHPDDETLAAGATLKKLSDHGTTLHVAIPATGVFSRKTQRSTSDLDAELKILQDDCRSALGVLGVESRHIYLGEFSDNQMDRHPLLEVIQWLEHIIATVAPEMIFTHHRCCTNIDHRICHEAAVVATRPGTETHIPVLCAEVPGSTGYLKPAQWEPNLFVDVSRAQLRAKIEAMQRYRGEARPDPHPRSPEVLEALAKVRGAESGFFFAEAFMIQKIFG